MIKVYVASKTKHALMWQAFRKNAPFAMTSTWIDMIHEDGTDDADGRFDQLWETIVGDVDEADGLILYVESGDFPLRGALVEVGLAISKDIPVAIVTPDIVVDERGNPFGTWVHHPLVSLHPSIHYAAQEMMVRAVGLEPTLRRNDA